MIYSTEVTIHRKVGARNTLKHAPAKVLYIVRQPAADDNRILYMYVTPRYL